MASGPEDTGKSLLPFLQRADELQKHDPLVAYYCRLYATEKGLKLPSKERSRETNDLLLSTLARLEKDKAALQLSPEDSLHVEGFAQRVFAKADKQDRAGQADISTAKTFYAAGLFFDVMRQFGELPPEVEQRQRYAAWKAADIRRALADGRQPTPGPPAGDAADAAGLLSAPAAAAATPAASAAATDGAGSGMNSGGAGPAGQGGQYDILGLPQPPSAQPLRPDHSGAAPGGATAGGGGAGGGGWAQGGAQQGPGVGRPHGNSAATTSSLGPAGATMNGSGAPRASAAAPPPFSAPVPAAPQPADTSSAGISTGMGMGGQAPPAGKVGDAHRAARFAVSALAFDDVPAAVDYLKQALRLLDEA
ncbi:hypothetical protein CLOM_g16739 [Closterium sp. NIES-68]|nr:hypothetical protein CLOM_g16739 [Closterium sp. NIES-68]